MIVPRKAIKEEPKIIEEKVVEKPQTLTEEESQMETVKEYENKFFDEDDEIIEVNFD